MNPSDPALTGRRGDPFARINWESPDSVAGERGNPTVVSKSGTVIVFACGCPSWMTYPDSAGYDPERALARLVDEFPERWDGAWLARYADGPPAAVCVHEAAS